MDNGLRTLNCPFSVREAVDRLVAALPALHMQLFASVDHSGGAESVGLSLRPTQLLLIGNPKGGTPFMQENQVSGLDLPLKLLIWEDEGGQAKLSYNDPRWIAERHGLKNSEATVQLLTGAMAKLAETVSAR